MKYYHITVLIFLSSLYSFAQTNRIHPQKLEVLEYCIGTDILMPYKLNGTFNPDNKFKLEISDSSGVFSYSNVIGSIKSIVADTIKGKFATHLPSGSKYKLRITSTSPAMTSEPMEGNIRIKDIPNYLAT